MNETDLTTSFTTPAAVVERKPRKRELKNLTKRNGVWHFHKLVKGKRLFNGRKTPFTLETRDLVVAKAKRDALLKAANGTEVDRVLGRSTVKPATLQEIFDAFLQADYPREYTRKKYIRCMKLVVRRALGGAPNFDNITVDELTGRLVADFQDSIVAEARKAGHKDQSEQMIIAKYSANRTMTQARSIFANEKPFRKLHLPRPSGFLEADDFKVKRDLSYQPMTGAELELFGAKSKELKTEQPGVYLVWLCMRWLGMRNSEVEACKPSEWLVETSRGFVMRITNQPYFQVKGVGSVRDLPVVGWLHEEITALAGNREWLVPGATVTDRHEITHYAINDWMEEIYDEAKAAGLLPAKMEARTAYDWRKQAGSELYAKTKNILEVSKWLGHQSVHTTTKWYVNLISGLPSLA